MNLSWIAIVGLASFRLTKLISKEAGPWDVFMVFRSWAGVYDIGPDKKPMGFLGKMIECPFCLGIWISFFLWLLPEGMFRRYFVGFLAVAGIQTILQAATMSIVEEE